jgi:diadenosine tetraphosphate (Ap4A) HIT family hydrolase
MPLKARDFLGKPWEFDCMGCAIARQALTVPGGFIRKSALFCVHQDPLIPLAGCIVIASRRHIRSIAEMSEPEYAEFAGLVRKTRSAIQAVVPVEYLTLVQEEHSGHFHLWFFPWLQDMIKKYGEPSLAKVRQIMAEVSREPISAAEWRELEASIADIKAQMA